MGCTPANSNAVLQSMNEEHVITKKQTPLNYSVQLSNHFLSEERSGFSIGNIRNYKSHKHYLDYAPPEATYNGFWVNNKVIEGCIVQKTSEATWKYSGSFNYRLQPNGFGYLRHYTPREWSNTKVKIEREYLGFWKDGKKDGFGEECLSGYKYRGGFIDDMYNGIGEMKNLTSRGMIIRKGYFVDGEFDGYNITITLVNGRPLTKVYAMYKQGRVSNGSHICTVNWTPSGPRYTSELQGIPLSNQKIHQLTQQDIQHQIKEFEGLENMRICEHILNFEESSGFVIEKEIFERSKFRVRLRVVDNIAFTAFQPKLYAKICIIQHINQLIFYSFEIKVYKILEKSEELKKYIADCMYEKKYWIKLGELNTGYVMHEYLQDQDNYEHLIKNPNIHIAAYAIYMEYMNHQDSLEYWIHNTYNLNNNPGLAIKLCQELFNMEKRFASNNMYFDKLSPENIYCSSYGSINLKITSLINIKIIIETQMHSKYTNIESRVDSEKEKRLKEDIFKETFHPSDYTYNKLSYLPPDLQLVVKKWINMKEENVKHNIVKTQIFGLAVISIEIFLRVFGLNIELRNLHTDIPDKTINDYKYWVELVISKLGNKYFGVILMNMIMLQYESLDDIPELSLDIYSKQE